jgi:D-alanyl-D-alanine carboxypeptidase/D-alanyl-D-alanine-endopeptidase (penicillin-binding protein 4)
LIFIAGSVLAQTPANKETATASANPFVTAPNTPTTQDYKNPVTDHLARIDELLASEGLDSKASGVVILDITGQNPIINLDEKRNFPVVYTHNPDLALATASVMKVFTTSSALHHLKPEYTFHTVLFADGPIIDGVLDGNLRVVGGGDPFLVPERLMLMVRELSVMGITKIDGQVTVDISGHNAPLHPSQWDPANFRYAYSAAVGNLSYSFNVVAMHVFGAGQDKLPARILLNPEMPGYSFVNKVTTSGTRSKLVYDVRDKPEGGMTIVVSGTIPQKAQTSDFFTVPDPTHFFVQALKTELSKQNIAVTDRSISCEALKKSEDPLLSFESLPLAVLTRSLNLYSNNVMAELIFRQMGAEVHGLPGTEAKGAQAVQDALTQMGLDPSNLGQVDGSGLSRTNRSTANLTAHLLARMALRPDIGPEFVSSLSANGATGTLQKHLADDEHYRRVRGKTGYINNVFGLAGYVYTKSGRLLAYCFLLNNVNSPYRDTWDNIFDPLMIEMIEL